VIDRMPALFTQVSRQFPGQARVESPSFDNLNGDRTELVDIAVRWRDHGLLIGRLRDNIEFGNLAFPSKWHTKHLAESRFKRGGDQPLRRGVTHAKNGRSSTGRKGETALRRPGFRSVLEHRPICARYVPNAGKCRLMKDFGDPRPSGCNPSFF